jgi:leucyl aminopeptidase
MNIKHFAHLTFLLGAFTWTFPTLGNEVWVAISPKVLSAMAKNKVRVFTPKESIEGSSENFYKIPETQLSDISHFVHHAFKRCGGYRVLAAPPIENLKSLKTKNLPDIEFGEFWPNELDKFIDVTYTIERQNEVNDWFNNISETHMNEVITKLSAYHTRYYNTPDGINALKWIGSQWEELTKMRNDMHVEYFKHADFLQPSIILTIEGSEPTKKDQIIILGGHGDSINADDREAGLRSPGADDNAAGIALLTDMIKIVVEKNYRPKHTIQFIAYAAEEVGLRGSAEIAKTYHQNQKKVIGVMQFDGVNYVGKTFEMAILSDGVSPLQSRFVANLVDEYVKASWSWEKCGYACSDHYSWHQEGYRASFPAETIASEQNPYIHTAEDTFDKSNFSTTHASLFEKLGIAYLLELDK